MLLFCTPQKCAYNFMLFCVFRHRVWGSNHCSFPSAGHTHRQSPCSKRGLLQTEPAQPHESHRHCICLCSSDILSGQLLSFLLRDFSLHCLRSNNRIVNFGNIHDWIAHSCPTYSLLLTGIQSGSAHQVSSLPWPVQHLPHQALLHLQHSHHPAVCLGLQLVCYFPDAFHTLQWQFPG